MRKFNSMMTKQLVMMPTLLLLICGFMGCAAKINHQRLQTSLVDLSSQDDRHYLGGFNQEQINIAQAVVKSMRPELPEQRCQSFIADDSDSVDAKDLPQATKPQPTKSITTSGLDVLWENLSSQNLVVRDLSLYVIALLGPSAAELMPWLSHYKQTDEYFSPWLNYALEQVGCHEWSSPKFRLPFPDTVGAEHSNFDLILDDFIINQSLYPPGVIRSFISNYDMGFLPSHHLNRVVKAINDPNLSRELKAELWYAISEQNSQFSDEVLNELIPLLNHQPNEIDYYLEDLFFANIHPAGLTYISEQLINKDLPTVQSVCRYGQLARHLEPRLMRLLGQSQEYNQDYELIEMLGCVGTEQSLSSLMRMYDPKDWEMQRLIIRAIKHIDADNPAVKTFLAEALTATWSQIIRDEITGQVELESCFMHMDGRSDTFCLAGRGITSRMRADQVDHGFSECEGGYEFSYDELTWFTVNWLGSDNSTLPKGFPEGWLNLRRGHSMLAVEDGFIFALTKQHNAIALLYWSADQQTDAYLIELGDAFKVLQHQNRILAMGYSFSHSYVDGDLFEIKKTPEGVWQASIVLNLPDVPDRYGFDPDGELLIADAKHNYGVKGDQISPLYCRKIEH